MKLKEQEQGKSHSHYRYLARQAKDLIVGHSVLKAGMAFEIESVIWTFRIGEQAIFASFKVRNLDTLNSFPVSMALNEWSIVDTFQSRECGC